MTPEWSKRRLTPEELRCKAAAYRQQYDDSPAEVLTCDQIKDEADLVLADLCEQVAELREMVGEWPTPQFPIRDFLLGAMRMKFDGPEITVSRPAPRTLKASEITEPGWYAYHRIPGGKWNVGLAPGLSYFDTDKSTLGIGWHSYELYGPIQLPE